MKPITPAEIVKHKLDTLPSEVIETFNELIAQNWDGHSSVVMQNAAITAIIAKLKSKDIKATRQELFNKHWLDVEDVYRKAGWKVIYDKPAYCETYEASFTFSKKK